MPKQKPDGPILLEGVQVKGRDFDKDGQETPKEELLRMPGLFKLKDVEGQIPIEVIRLKHWNSSDETYRNWIVKIPMVEK